MLRFQNSQCLVAMRWEDFLKNLQVSSTCTSLSLNFVLILLIVNKSPKQLGSYRYLMIYVALFEMVYSMVDMIVSPTVFSHRSMFLVIVSNTNHIFSKSFLLLLDCTLCGLFGSFMFIFFIQFIYRYWVVVGSQKIKSFNDYRLVLWISFPAIFGTLWTISVYFFMDPTEETDNVLENVLLSELNLHIADINYIGPHCHITNTGELILDTGAIIVIICMMIIVTFSSVSMIIIAVITYLKIKKTLGVITISRKSQQLQTQTFYALVTQTTIPVILMHFPCSMVLCASMMNIELGHLVGIVSLNIAIFPALDPLPVMFIIKSYRGTLFNVMTSTVEIFKKRPIVQQ